MTDLMKLWRYKFLYFCHQSINQHHLRYSMKYEMRHDLYRLLSLILVNHARHAYLDDLEMGVKCTVIEDNQRAWYSILNTFLLFILFICPPHIAINKSKISMAWCPKMTLVIVNKIHSVKRSILFIACSQIFIQLNILSSLSSLKIDLNTI